MSDFPPQYDDLTDQPRKAYLDTLAPGEEDKKAWEELKDKPPDSVLVAYQKEIDLVLKPSEEVISDGETQVLDLYRKKDGLYRIGCIHIKTQRADPEVAARALKENVKETTQVLMAVREEEPGVVGRLLLKLELPRGGQLEHPQSREGPDQEWKESIPDTPDFGSDWKGEDGSGYDDGYPGGGGGRKPKEVALPVGRIVRFQQDRRFPDNLQQEARDLLGQALAGNLPPVRDRLMERLTSDSPDADNPEHGDQEPPGRGGPTR